MDIDDLDPDPIVQLQAWLAEAAQAPAAGGASSDPTAMAVATSTPDGKPSVRFVLCKGIDERGVVFYTNTESRKGRELAANRHAAAAFWWPALDRQARVEGSVEAIPSDEADAYYASRALGSRLGAWASPQSQVVDSRAELDEAWSAAAARFGTDPPRPPHWGGFVIRPDSVELWQHQADRLHDRIVYRRQPSGSWSRQRLGP